MKSLRVWVIRVRKIDVHKNRFLTLSKELICRRKIHRKSKERRNSSKKLKKKFRVFFSVECVQFSSKDLQKS